MSSVLKTFPGVIFRLKPFDGIYHTQEIVRYITWLQVRFILNIYLIPGMNCEGPDIKCICMEVLLCFKYFWTHDMKVLCNEACLSINLSETLQLKNRYKDFIDFWNNDTEKYKKSWQSPILEKILNPEMILDLCQKIRLFWLL